MAARLAPLHGFRRLRRVTAPRRLGAATATLGSAVPPHWSGRVQLALRGRRVLPTKASVAVHVIGRRQEAPVGARIVRWLEAAAEMLAPAPHVREWAWVALPALL